MRLLASNEYQKRELEMLHPDRKVADYFALIPSGEYFYWSRKFTLLLDDLYGRFPAMRNAAKAISAFPIVQCVTKLCTVNSEGYLNPRVFKFRTLPEGMRDFGFSSPVVSRLDVLASSFPFVVRKFPNRYRLVKDTYLGFLAWDQTSEFNHGSRYLPSYVHCAGKLSDVKLTEDNVLMYDNEAYQYLLPTSNHFNSPQFQELLGELHLKKMLVLPLTFPLVNLKNLIGFTNPVWAEVNPLEFFLDEPPQIAANYLLIRTDDGKRLTWDEVMNDAKLRLELEMSEYWLWQQSCPAAPTLEHINMYWTFGQDYPWLIDKRDGKWVPAFVVET